MRSTIVLFLMHPSRIPAPLAAMLFALGTMCVAANAFGESAQANIVMIPALEIATDEGPAYKVNFSYQAPGRKLVRLKGVGIVSAVGRMSYITSDPRIELLDPKTNEILASATVTDPVRMMGGAQFELPDLESFSEAYKTGRWLGETPFVDHANRVLNDAFRFGYRAFQQGDKHFLATTFTEVSGVQEPVTAEVALLIEYPTEADPNNTPFLVRLSARERRSHSDWRAQLTGVTKPLVADAFNKFVSRLQTPN